MRPGLSPPPDCLGLCIDTSYRNRKFSLTREQGKRFVHRYSRQLAESKREASGKPLVNRPTIRVLKSAIKETTTDTRIPLGQGANEKRHRTRRWLHRWPSSRGGNDHQ
jgi:hypothetical protein